jgi:hypothetical protein
MKVKYPANIACQLDPQFLKSFGILERFGVRLTEPKAEELEQIDPPGTLLPAFSWANHG